nr:histone-lysine N-methyltransferase ATX4-like [Ipomoea batatas]
MVLGLKRCLPDSMCDADRGFRFSDPKKHRNNDVLPGELNRCVVNSRPGGFLARNPPIRILDSELGPKPYPSPEDVIPEMIQVVCNDTEGIYFPGLHMVQCGCKPCIMKKNNAKRSVGDWEKHAGSRAKKWKVSIKVKATRKPLGEWVSDKSAVTTPAGLGFNFNPGLNPSRLSAFLSQKHTPITQKWTPERCAVCRWNEDWDYDKIVICNKCEMAVHQKCYGVSHINDFTHWLCNACKNPSLNPECCLCPVKGGALKPCDVKPFWVHVICAWFRPEMYFPSDKMEPALGLMRVPPKTFQQTCQICNQTHGACVQCCKCSNTYHIPCAFRAGFSLEMMLIANKNTNKLILHCNLHKPPNPDSKLEMRILHKTRNQALESSSSNKPEPEPDDQALERTAKKREKPEAIINARLNFEKEPENGRGFSSMPERMKHLQRTMKQRICFGKSGIHGWGVFARRRIREGEAVGEYVGEVVRRSVSDVREARYNAAGRDCYLFGINEDMVIDATMKGSLTRLFNHCCDPNCYSRIVNLGEGDYGVVLIAKRDVDAGEELTMDYMFDHNKDYKPTTPCFCGAPNCRKFM